MITSEFAAHQVRRGIAASEGFPGERREDIAVVRVSEEHFEAECCCDGAKASNVDASW